MANYNMESNRITNTTIDYGFIGNISSDEKELVDKKVSEISDYLAKHRLEVSINKDGQKYIRPNKAMNMVSDFLLKQQFDAWVYKDFVTKVYKVFDKDFLLKPVWVVYTIGLNASKNVTSNQKSDIVGGIVEREVNCSDAIKEKLRSRNKRSRLTTATDLKAFKAALKHSCKKASFTNYYKQVANKEIHYPAQGGDYVSIMDTGVGMGIGKLFRTYFNVGNSSKQGAIDTISQGTYGAGNTGILPLTTGHMFLTKVSDEDAMSLVLIQGVSVDTRQNGRVNSNVYLAFVDRKVYEENIGKEHDDRTDPIPFMEVGYGESKMCEIFKELMLPTVEYDANDSVRNFKHGTLLKFFLRKNDGRLSQDYDLHSLYDDFYTHITDEVFPCKFVEEDLNAKKIVSTRVFHGINGDFAKDATLAAKRFGVDSRDIFVKGIDPQHPENVNKFSLDVICYDGINNTATDIKAITHNAEFVSFIHNDQVQAYFSYDAMRLDIPRNIAQYVKIQIHTDNLVRQHMLEFYKGSRQGLQHGHECVEECIKKVYAVIKELVENPNTSLYRLIEAVREKESKSLMDDFLKNIRLTSDYRPAYIDRDVTITPARLTDKSVMEGCLHRTENNLVHLHMIDSKVNTNRRDAMNNHAITAEVTFQYFNSGDEGEDYVKARDTKTYSETVTPKNPDPFVRLGNGELFEVTDIKTADGVQTSNYTFFLDPMKVLPEKVGGILAIKVSIFVNNAYIPNAKRTTGKTKVCGSKVLYRLVANPIEENGKVWQDKKKKYKNEESLDFNRDTFDPSVNDGYFMETEMKSVNPENVIYESLDNDFGSIKPAVTRKKGEEKGDDNDPPIEPTSHGRLNPPATQHFDNQTTEIVEDDSINIPVDTPKHKRSAKKRNLRATKCPIPHDIYSTGSDADFEKRFVLNDIHHPEKAKELMAKYPEAVLLSNIRDKFNDEWYGDIFDTRLHLGEYLLYLVVPKPDGKSIDTVYVDLTNKKVEELLTNDGNKTQAELELNHVKFWSDVRDNFNKHKDHARKMSMNADGLNYDNEKYLRQLEFMLASDSYMSHHI